MQFVDKLKLSENVKCETTEDKCDETENTVKEPDEEDKEEVVKVVAQKGVSITRALIMFGFESWSALEPGNYCLIQFQIFLINFCISAFRMLQPNFTF